MCNYIWHRHRDKYVWKYDNFWRYEGDWNATREGEISDFSFLIKENAHPIIRISVHFSYTSLGPFDLPHGRKMTTRGIFGHLKNKYQPEKVRHCWRTLSAAYPWHSAATHHCAIELRKTAPGSAGWRTKFRFPCTALKSIRLGSGSHAVCKSNKSTLFGDGISWLVAVWSEDLFQTVSWVLQKDSGNWGNWLEEEGYHLDRHSFFVFDFVYNCVELAFNRSSLGP